MADFTRAARLYDKGLPPVHGGQLDQTTWFVEAFDFYTSDTANIRRALGV